MGKIKNKNAIFIGAFIGVGILLGAIRFFPGDPTIIPSNGLHYHAQLAIYVDGQKQPLPPNIGLGFSAHAPIHTHAEDAAAGVIHLEYAGVVHANDLRLSKFFTIWGRKNIRTAFGTLEKMTVNGKENTSYGAYEIHDGDAINLYYTKNPASAPSS